MVSDAGRNYDMECVGVFCSGRTRKGDHPPGYGSRDRYSVLRMSLRLSELHPVYRQVDPDEARLIANLGAEVYVAARDRLREAWTTEMSAEEGTKADVWRTEGRVAALEEVKGRLAAGEAAAARVETLQASIEAEVARRTEEMVTLRKKEYELKLKEDIHALETQLAEMRGAAKMYAMLEEAQDGMRKYAERLEEDLAKYKANSTKSSHAIGKIGEAAMFEMLNQYVLPKFPFSEVKDMTAVKHAGDFHIWVFGPTGKRVKIMLDVKKYCAPVQNVEVDKLFADLDGDEAEVGIMVSLDSGIYNRAQFQIVRTKRNKPCMFLTFEKLDDGIRQEVLCWAVRTLACVASLHDSAEQNEMLVEIQSFLVDMNTSAGELETCMKSAKALYDMLRGMKEKMVARITAFKGGEAVVTNVSQTVTVSDDDMRCRALVGSGGQCRSRRTPTGIMCQRHEAMVVAGKILNVAGGV
jgi:hypothetical protein